MDHMAARRDFVTRRPQLEEIHGARILLPSAERPQERLHHVPGHGAAGEPPQRLDRLTHLFDVRSTMRTGLKMRLEADTIGRKQRSLKVLRRELYELFAGHASVRHSRSLGRRDSLPRLPASGQASVLTQPRS